MRISVNLSEETIRRLDKIAKENGTSRGSMLTVWINEKIRNLDRSENLINQILNSEAFALALQNEMSDSQVIKEVKNRNAKK